MHWFQGAFWSWETVPTMEHWNQFWDASWMYGIYCIYWLSWPRFIEQISSNHAIHPVKEAVSIYHKSQETDPGNCTLFDKEKYTTLRLFFFFFSGRYHCTSSCAVKSLILRLNVYWDERRKSIFILDGRVNVTCLLLNQGSWSCNLSKISFWNRNSRKRLN